MRAERAFAVLPVLDASGAGTGVNGQAAHAGPRHARIGGPVPYPATSSSAAGTDATGRWLIAGVCVLLAGLAVAMGVTSFHAQFAYIFATKRQWAPAVLEALGLDTGAVTFALLGIALARLGRRAAVERVLVLACALGSCGMNVLNANLASPRSVAVYGMPPILFALTSDRLIAVIRRAALGRADDDEQRSAWHLAGRAALYALRLTVDVRGTVRGTRQAILDATPLPRGPLTRDGEPPVMFRRLAPSAAASAQENISPGHRRSGHYQPRQGTKTARFLALVRDRHGPLAGLPLAQVCRISGDLAPGERLPRYLECPECDDDGHERGQGRRRRYQRRRSRCRR
jgi:hypothetical protein